MVRTREAVERVGIRIPEGMTDEIKRIIENHPELSYNRQQFVESAIREKIERIKMMERPLNAEAEVEEDFLLIINEQNRKRVAKIYLRELQGLVDMGRILSIPEVQRTLRARKLKIGYKNFKSTERAQSTW